MVDLTKPSFLTPTITVNGDVVVGKPLRVSSTPSDSKPGEPEEPEITGTVITFDESINAIDLPNNPWFPESTQGGVYNGKTYWIHRQIDLLGIFKTKFGRNPNPGETVSVVIPDDRALVGDRSNTGEGSGILIKAEWPESSPINITNRGLILGLGGGGVVVFEPNFSDHAGYTGIKNLSTSSVIVKNYGVIAGGGGGGGAALGLFNTNGRGGGGAPYGKAGVAAAQPGSFVTGGEGSVGNYNRIGGAGGDWGLAGKEGSDGGTNVDKRGGEPGYITEGPVVVENIHNGWTRGREGYFIGDGVEPVEPIDPEPPAPETPTINAKGHFISYGGQAGANGYMDTSGAAIQGAHGAGGAYAVLEEADLVTFSKKSTVQGRVGGSVNYWDVQPGGEGWRDYFNEIVGKGGDGTAPAKTGTATAGGAGGGGAQIKGVIRNTTNQTVQLQAYCGKAYHGNGINVNQMGLNGSLQLLISTISDNTGADTEFIYPNEGRTPTDIIVRNNETAEIWVIGGGGGAGGADKTTVKGGAGSSGGTSTLNIANVEQVAKGGSGGTAVTATPSSSGYDYKAGSNGAGGVATVNKTYQLPTGVEVSFDIIETGFVSSGKSTKGTFKAAEGKIIGSWGVFGIGGQAGYLVEGVSPGAGGGGSYIKAIITNKSGENFIVKGIAGGGGYDGLNNQYTNTNEATDGIIIVRRGGIVTVETDVVAEVPTGAPKYLSLAINEEMDIELIGGGGAGGSVNTMTSSARANATGNMGETTSIMVLDQLVWDGSQYRVKTSREISVGGGIGGGYSEGGSPGVNGFSTATWSGLPESIEGIEITGAFTAGKVTTRTDNNVVQIGAIGFTAINEVVYGSGGTGGEGSPATPGAGSSGSYFKGTIKNTSNKVFNFRALTGKKGLINNNSAPDVYQGKPGFDGGIVYKRRYNSGSDEMILVYPEDGQQDIMVPNNAQAEIWIIGGGGAFGGSTTLATPVTGVSVLIDGEAGKDSQVVIGTNSYLAKGGAGGKGAVGGTVSTSVGASGTTVTPSSPTPITGVTIRVDESLSSSAPPTHIEKTDNPGGKIIPGVGQYGYGGSSRWNTQYQTADGFVSNVYHGGSGGSGGYIKLTVNNTSGVSQSIRAIAGRAGTRGAEFYDIAEMAGTGLVAVKIKKL